MMLLITRVKIFLSAMDESKVFPLPIAPILVTINLAVHPDVTVR